MNEVIELKVPLDIYKRLVKVVNSYESNRLKSRSIAQKKLDEEREAFNNQVRNAGLEKLVRKSRKKEEPLVKVLRIEDYVIGNAPMPSPRSLLGQNSSDEDI